MSSSSKFRVLVSNDDGIGAPGIVELVRALRSLNSFDIRVSSPSVEQSARSHAITIHESLTAHAYKLPGALSDVNSVAVDGTPVDCVKLALESDWFGQWRPQLVVSGINRGSNSGMNVYYSGTVGAAREGNINRIPAVALSLSFASTDVSHFHFAATQSAKLIERLCVALGDADEATLDVFRAHVINVNFPNMNEDEQLGWRYTKPGVSFFSNTLKAAPAEPDDLPGTRRFHLEGKLSIREPLDNHDIDTPAMAAGFQAISVLPLHFYAPDSTATHRWVQQFVQSESSEQE
jgi:5'/3'-nucleotidase